MRYFRLRLTTFLLLFLPFIYSCGFSENDRSVSASIPNPKNVIIFIGDGMGYNQVLAANYYEYGHANAQPYEQGDWVRLASATYPAVVRISGPDTTFAGGYNPQMAWSDPDYINHSFTGSAESATAMSTGIKTFTPSIGIGIYGDTLMHISQLAKELGKSTGIVTSVQFTHATPAGFAAHNRSRGNYEELATYLLFNTKLDLIIGAGNPDYNNNGQPQESNDRFVGGRELWEQLLLNDARTAFVVDGDTLYVQDATGDGRPDPWTLIQDRDDFIAMASGATPNRVLGVPRVNTTLHYGRAGNDQLMPFEKPLNENIPRLDELTRASLNLLGNNPKGFFVMIEGGAIDWAGHANHLGRNIEEQIDFNNAIKAAIEWVETYSSWDETLIVVTSDHETGYLTGPDHPDVIKQAVVNRGKGELPYHQWNSTSHTNMLVPFYAKGKGAELFKLFADEMDPVRGPFIQHSELAQALFIMWWK